MRAVYKEDSCGRPTRKRVGGPLASVARPYRMASSQSVVICSKILVVVLPVGSVTISTFSFGDLDLSRSAAMTLKTEPRHGLDIFGAAGLAGGIARGAGAAAGAGAGTGSVDGTGASQIPTDNGVEFVVVLWSW